MSESIRRGDPLTRAHVTVRDAVPEDMPGLLELFGELRAAGPKRLPIGAGDAAYMRAAVEARYRRTFDDPAERLLVAVDRDSRIVGMTLLTLGPVSTMHEARSVTMGHFTVRTSIRRHGIGRALVAAATAWADEMGVDTVGVEVYPSSREANRFYARLGFAPISITRVAAVGGLRRRLGSEVPVAGEAADAQGARRRRLRVGVTSTRPLAAVRRNPLG
jgi:GNAT superfamily N-acetyltransferase